MHYYLPSQWYALEFRITFIPWSLRFLYFTRTFRLSLSFSEEFKLCARFWKDVHENNSIPNDDSKNRVISWKEKSALSASNLSNDRRLEWSFDNISRCIWFESIVDKYLCKHIVWNVFERVFLSVYLFSFPFHTLPPSKVNITYQLYNVINVFSFNLSCLYTVIKSSFQPIFLVKRKLTVRKVGFLSLL